jgi:hypothetical protein
MPEQNATLKALGQLVGRLKCPISDGTFPLAGLILAGNTEGFSRVGQVLQAGRWQ